MREKLVLAATLTFSLYLFVGVSASVKTPKNYVMRSPEGSVSPAKTAPRYAVISQPNWFTAFPHTFE